MEGEKVATSDTSGTETKAASSAATASGVCSAAKEVTEMTSGESTEGTGTALGKTTGEAGVEFGVTKEGRGMMSNAMEATAVVDPDIVTGTGAGVFTGIGRGRGLDIVGSCGSEVLAGAGDEGVDMVRSAAATKGG